MSTETPHIVNRRSAIQGGLAATATALGIPQVIAAQSTPAASPSPAASPVSGEVVKSITRDEYFAQVAKAVTIEPAKQTTGTLVQVFTQDATTLNPALQNDTYSWLIINMLFDGLVETSVVDGQVVPGGFADRWEVASDGVTYTFFLRPEAVWHDGTPVTAHDCVFTLDAIRGEDSLSVRKGTLDGLVQSYRAIDDTTFELVSKQKSAVFLSSTVAQFKIVPKHIWADVAPGEWGSDPGSNGQDPKRVIGNGPWTFSEWKLGSSITLTRNASYWDPNRIPKIERYIFNIVGDDNTALASLKTGDSDAYNVSPNDAPALKQSNPEIQVAEFDTASFTMYCLNQDAAKEKRFTDVKVRQALHYALDRETMAKKLLGGYATVARGPQPTLSPAFAPDEMNTVYDYDPSKAKALLDEAGWKDPGTGVREKDGLILEFDMLYDEGTASYKQIMPFIQQMWAAVGVKMQPAGLPFATLLEKITTFNYTSCIVGFGWGYDGMQGSMFRSDSLSPNGFNLTAWADNEYDRLDSAAQSELDDDARRELLVQAANIANDGLPVGVLVFDRAVAAASPRVHNFLPNGYGWYWWLNYAWLEDGL